MTEQIKATQIETRRAAASPSLSLTVSKIVAPTIVEQDKKQLRFDSAVHHYQDKKNDGSLSYPTRLQVPTTITEQSACAECGQPDQHYRCDICQDFCLCENCFDEDMHGHHHSIQALDDVSAKTTAQDQDIKQSKSMSDTLDQANLPQKKKQDDQVEQVQQVKEQKQNKQDEQAKDDKVTGKSELALNCEALVGLTKFMEASNQQQAHEERKNLSLTGQRTEKLLQKQHVMECTHSKRVNCWTSSMLSPNSWLTKHVDVIRGYWQTHSRHDSPCQLDQPSVDR